jgi:hypothetical protein
MSTENKPSAAATIGVLMMLIAAGFGCGVGAILTSVVWWVAS